MKARTVAVAAALLPALWGCAGAPEPEAERRPNIVLILADDLGYGEIGPYGQEIIQTPNLDRLAAEGMVFSDAYSGGAVCAPSRSSLMSGLHTGHSPVRANGGGNPIQPDDWTIAEVLRPAGYTSAGFGKWGLGDINTTGVPWLQGFDEFFGYLHQVHAHYFYPEYLWKNDQQVALEGNRRDVAEGRYSADVIHEQALEYLRNHVRLADALKAQSPEKRESPLFLYLAYTLPHGEYQVPEDSAAPYRGRFEEKPIPARDDHAAQPEPFATYAGMISRLDRQVGEVLDAIDKLGIAEEHARDLHQRQRTVATAQRVGFIRLERAAAGAQGPTLRGRRAGAVHRALDGQDRAGVEERRTRGVLGPAADVRGAGGRDAGGRGRWRLDRPRAARRGRTGARANAVLGASRRRSG